MIHNAKQIYGHFVKHSYIKSLKGGGGGGVRDHTFFLVE